MYPRRQISRAYETREFDDESLAAAVRDAHPTARECMSQSTRSAATRACRSVDYLRGFYTRRASTRSSWRPWAGVAVRSSCRRLSFTRRLRRRSRRYRSGNFRARRLLAHGFVARACRFSISLRFRGVANRDGAVYPRRAVRVRVGSMPLLIRDGGRSGNAANAPSRAASNTI